MTSSRSNRPTSAKRRARDMSRDAEPSTPAADTATDTVADTASPTATEGRTTTSAPSPRRSSAPTPAGAMAIVVDRLSKEYGEVHALQPLSLVIGRGDRVSLIGHNGSGKTTLIKMLVGLLEPTGGTATVAGHPVGSLQARASVSYLSDEPVFYDDLSVWEHLEYVARLHGRDDWEGDAHALVDDLGLRQRVDDLPVTFSRGLRQKAAIAIGFIRPFEVLLVDEPFVGLDQRGREALLGLLTAAHDAGATVVVATHELSSVEASSRLIALANGIVIHDGPPSGVDLTELTNATSAPRDPLHASDDE